MLVRGISSLVWQVHVELNLMCQAPACCLLRFFAALRTNLSFSAWPSWLIEWQCLAGSSPWLRCSDLGMSQNRGAHGRPHDFSFDWKADGSGPLILRHSNFTTPVVAASEWYVSGLLRFLANVLWCSLMRRWGKSMFNCSFNFNLSRWSTEIVLGQVRSAVVKC